MTAPSNNQTKLVELAYQRSSKLLETQAQIAGTVDQRSLVFSTLSVAAAALVFDALKNEVQSNYAVGAALFLCLAAVFSAISAVPGRMYPPGSRSDELTDAIQSDTEYCSVLLGVCKNNDYYAEQNEMSAKIRAHLYRFSVLLFLFGIGLALLGFVNA